MEQQIQGRDRQRPEEPALREQTAPQLERARLSGPGLLAKALQEGAPLLEMPPERLAELAAVLGNQYMEALLEGQALPVEEAAFNLPGQADTEPFPVPQAEPPLMARSVDLTGGAGGRAFDPAGLLYGGGGAFE